MVHPGRGKCQKRKKDSNVPLQVVDCTPLQLWAWWNDMGLIEQGIIFKYLGFLTRIMQVEPKRDAIEALLSFWNPTNNVFRFSNFEMTLTLEEITGFTGFGVRLHHQRLISPRGISINKFFQHLNICKVKEQSLDKEHLYRPPTVARFIQDRSDYITSHSQRVEKYRCPEGRCATIRTAAGFTIGPKIWDGCLVMGIGTMVKERHTGETHPEYSNWIEQQPRLQVRPERSVKEPIDHEAKMKVKIELAMRDYLAENQELRANLELAKAALTQQQVEFEEERAKAIQRETLLRGQVDLATIRGTQVAELAVSRQQQLRTCDQKSQTDFDQERAQWIRERGRLREEIESVSTQERRTREMVASRDQQIRGWNQTCNSLRSKVRRLADRTAQMGLDYEEMNHEQFLVEVPEFAEYLMNSVQDIYQSVGGRVRPPSP
ncbi:hypothetical protein KY290_036821 [Solanum tuberosum]|uniref:Aminotransferase-like plant mobile domain-containing protein n=1 Tax=Solanum tuberosum TaxID=4113 RepID=A0ABQ7TTT2_SOLTU|nr:hypothetical protein KY285_036140 [Solanum tuberosum]KAH0738116.1 hypothetical protein KY290_036821 [Solanum tuberosum]